MINVFISYAPEDEKYKIELDKHLHALQRQGILENKYERNELAGAEWKITIDKNIRKSNVIILLLSSDYLASDFIHENELFFPNIYKGNLVVKIFKLFYSFVKFCYSIQKKDTKSVILFYGTYIDALFLSLCFLNNSLVMSLDRRHIVEFFFL